MRAVSLFSGVGGIDLAFERAGIETVLQAERDPWCNEVLARHWPLVRRVDDVRDVGARRVQPDTERCGAVGAASAGRGQSLDGVDVVYGGFPCQPFSVAGKRGGADDGRNGWPEFRRIVSELRPRWVVAENVPGLLSIDSGRYFGQIISELDELGFDVAWAVLDAQHFGVPQRRRRVFIVAGPRGRGPEQVLSLCEGCGGNPETGGAAGEGVAVTLRGRSHSAGVNPPGRGGEEAFGDNLIAHSLRAQGNDSHREDTSTYVVAQPLAIRGRADGANAELGGTVGNALRAGDGGSSRSQLIHTHVASAISASAGHHGYSSPRGDGSDNLVADTVRSHVRPGSNSLGGIVHPALNVRDAKGPSSNADQAPPLVTEAGVRRLTPRECNRLQGFPDDWDRWTADGREIADSHRYRMMGNAVAVPVLEWIGRRLVAVDEASRNGTDPLPAVAGT